MGMGMLDYKSYHECLAITITLALVMAVLDGHIQEGITDFSVPMDIANAIATVYDTVSVAPIQPHFFKNVLMNSHKRRGSEFVMKYVLPQT